MQSIIRKGASARVHALCRASVGARLASTATMTHGDSHSEAMLTNIIYSGQRSSGQSNGWLSVAPMAAAAVLATLGLQQADSCGIIGVVGGGDDASKYLMEGLTIMRNRGCVLGPAQ